MSTTPATIYRPSLLPKDLGVALVVLVALALGWLLMFQTQNRTRTFHEADGGIQMLYPATWNSVDSLQDLLIKLEDPLTDSAFKTTLSIERRDLDPANPPTLQTLLDRRIEDRTLLTGYHLLADSETSLDGERAIMLEYAYVVQPIDTPRRASLPVVVHARDYLVIAQDRAYIITMAAPADAFSQVSPVFTRVAASIQLP
ncbi:hypothetical protein OSCT_1956 [Oscillochloris trichoides DG-6]|uniref:PsbP C-terminal domain-containing protein n=1 Tax=Oscillochloris trichoides DG-6 TaxID=765420 RepID=E1IF55_9CHLR|nr:hypothetical protein [Oscillochloris trichoides]EFO80154.1 hypothetical protein OSCT_1956 [Oscillochloris trichoides DG-6]